MQNNQEIIARVWEVELQILDVIHEICVKHKLRYTLAYGTLIGAVRHGSFIPWDDDIDIMMPREDYEKLLSIWSSVAPAGYALQNIRTNPDFVNTFSKVRKDHTTFLQDKIESEKKYHKGIFVDVFPADRVASGRVSNVLQYIACAVNLLYTRGYASGSKGMIGLIEQLLLIVPKSMQRIMQRTAERFICRWNGKKNLKWFVPSTIEYAKHYYKADLFQNMKTITFCDKEYCCVEDVDTFLRADYGDYMQLPPMHERVWKHHPIIIDFEHNFEEIDRENEC